MALISINQTGMVITKNNQAAQISKESSKKQR